MIYKQNVIKQTNVKKLHYEYLIYLEIRSDRPKMEQRSFNRL